MRYELSPDCPGTPSPATVAASASTCDAHVEDVTPFELPDLRKLVAAGKYVASRVGRGRIEFNPTDAAVDRGGRQGDRVPAHRAHLLTAAASTPPG